MKAAKVALPLLFISLLLLMPAISDAIKHPTSFVYTLQQLVVPLLYFLLPVVIFYRHLHLYLYVLLAWVILTPFFLCSIVMYDVKPGVDLAYLIMQTNRAEVSELVSLQAAAGLAVGTLAYVIFFGYFIKRLPVTHLPFKRALAISLCAALLISIEFYQVITTNRPGKYRVYFERYYPLSFAFGVFRTYVHVKENNLDKAKLFSFHAYRKDSNRQRQVHVLVIGESSRYDHWQLNGYNRPTSPRLSQRKNLINYPNAIAASYLTSHSVPQIITRAEPNNMSLQYKEKSILGAFKESGFKTAWLSNQSGKEVFSDGTITAHGKMADFCVFNTYESTYENRIHYDERLLPILDSLLTHTKDHQFIVLHTLGNHWKYTQRYPKHFDYFQPSGYTESDLSPTIPYKTVLLNTYDNATRYSDFIIDSIISLVNKYNAVSTVTFVPDHGEDLFEYGTYRSNFHLNASVQTLRIPFFIWTSSHYQKTFPNKEKSLQANTTRKVSAADNVFYTVLDMANISFPGFDDTKSLASPSCKDSRQLYYEHKQKKALPFHALMKSP
jgi:glucan phosphoethanolaminetransferase (alkaline phosphatase superfamily)